MLLRTPVEVVWRTRRAQGYGFCEGDTGFSGEVYFMGYSSVWPGLRLG